MKTMSDAQFDALFYMVWLGVHEWDRRVGKALERRDWATRAAACGSDEPHGPHRTDSMVCGGVVAAMPQWRVTPEGRQAYEREAERRGRSRVTHS